MAVEAKKATKQFICTESVATCPAYHTYAYHIRGKCRYKACQFVLDTADTELVAAIVKHCTTSRHERKEGSAAAALESRIRPADIPDVVPRSKKEPAPMPLQVKHCTYEADEPVYVNGKWWKLVCADPPDKGFTMCSACYRKKRAAR